MPRTLRRLVYGVVGGGIASVGASIALIEDRPDWWRLGVVFLAFLVGETAIVHIRLGHDRRTFTWAETACIISLAVAPAGWVVALGTLGAALPHIARRRPPVKVAFNASSVAIGLFLAVHVREVLGGPFETIDLTRTQAWIALAGAAVVYFAVTTAMVSGAVALSQGLGFWSVHLKDLPPNALVATGNIAVGVLVVSEAALEPLLLLPLPLITILLVILYRSYLRMSQDRDMWESLHGASREMLKLDQAQLTPAMLQWAARLFAAEAVDLVTVVDGGARVHTWRSDTEGHDVRDGDPFAIAGTFWGRALSEREPFEIHVDRAAAVQRAELTEANLVSCLVAPLLIEDECVGALRIGFRGRTRLRRREWQVFSTFSNNVSAALHNAHLFGELQHIALRDPLTALPNRAYLLNELDAALARSRRSGRSIAVLFLDLDQFKVVNDSLGHEVGDALLVEVSDRLRRAMRGGDIAARFGGDEFVVVCDDVSSEAHALEIATRLTSVMAGAVNVAGNELFVTASVGVSISHGGHSDATGLIRDADAAMYEAKANGRARVGVFDASTRAKAVARLETESDLRQAVARRELRLVYQPTLDPTTQRVVGAEAMLRWHHPTRGIVNPLEFVPLAEETGLISSIGAWVIDESCRQLAEWRSRSNFLEDGFRLGVNLSAHQLSDPRLVHDILATLGRHGVPASLLCVEITESALLLDTEIVANNIRHLRQLGIELALDDFGTGYSSVSYLHRLPVEVLKIDRSFIGRLGNSPRDDAIVAALVELAHTLGMSVVAEGVETASQLSALQQIGCDRVQGYYFARPLAAADFEDLVATVTAF